MSNQLPDSTPPPSPPGRGAQTRPPRSTLFWLLVLAGLVGLFYYNSLSVQGMPVQMPYGEFYSLLTSPVGEGVRSAVLIEDEVQGELSDGTAYRVRVPNDPDLVRVLRERVKTFSVRRAGLRWSSLFYSLGPMLLFIGFLWFFIYRGAPGGGGRILSFGKSRAKQTAAGHVKTTFRDVAGVDEAKEELKEVIDFLREPKKFQRLGGKIPKGVLLMGPPGTGKTLLAKAVAGEADVPFFTISGSDFVEMFVGVGASRVRDLFEQAKKSAKTSGKGCIIFIDEIDAVGRQRFAGIGGGHDEREQTLNALLVEMDGFNSQEGVILIAATNRPDVLDPALLRPGRFDRQVVIDRPDIVGREAILEVHTKNITLGSGVTLNSIARQTPGFSGADLANLANEAALLAARREKEFVEMSELEEAIERVMSGPERKSRVISDYEKQVVAHHEAGHALLALLIQGVDPLHKVSIIPRGTAALGYTMQLPLEDRYLMTKDELLGRMTVLLGGRVSESLMFEEISTGAQNDLETVTSIARRMVTEFGMSERLGSLTFGQRQGPVFLGRDITEERNYSEETARVIDQEVRSLVDGCYAQAKEKLEAHQSDLKKLADSLLEHEVLDGEEVKRILGLDGQTGRAEDAPLKEQPTAESDTAVSPPPE